MSDVKFDGYDVKDLGLIKLQGDTNSSAKFEMLSGNHAVFTTHAPTSLSLMGNHGNHVFKMWVDENGYLQVSNPEKMSENAKLLKEHFDKLNKR